METLRFVTSPGGGGGIRAQINSRGPDLYGRGQNQCKTYQHIEQQPYPYPLLAAYSRYPALDICTVARTLPDVQSIGKEVIKRKVKCRLHRKLLNVVKITFICGPLVITLPGTGTFGILHEDEVLLFFPEQFIIFWLYCATVELPNNRVSQKFLNI